LRFRFVRVAACCALALAACWGQTARKNRKPVVQPANAERASWPLESFTVEGNRHVTRDQILAVSGLRIGQTAGKPEFDAARDRLVATGAFESVAYSFTSAPGAQGYAAVLQVVEVDSLYAALFEDLPVREADLRAWLKSKDPLFVDRIPGTKEALARYSKLVNEYMEAHGYHEPVTATLSSEHPPELVALFRTATPRPSVAQVKFTNTGDLPAPTVQSAFYNVAIGSLYSESHFRDLLDTGVRPLYEARGRLGVTFPKIATEPAKDVKGVIVTVQVEQGPAYKLGKVNVQGAPSSNDDLVKTAKLANGELANFDEVNAAQARITDSVRREGYMRARTEVSRKLNEADKTVDVTFRVEPGPQFTFGKLLIVGLDITSEPVIRKMWGLKEGKPFNPHYAPHFLDIVKEEGLFEGLHSTEAQNKINADDKTVDVTLVFK
jgi:outer membrane protein insertion porin family